MQDVYARWNRSLRQALADRGMTQAALAQRADLTPSAVSRILSGRTRPSDEVKWRLAGALGERVDLLWAWPAVVPPPPVGAGAEHVAADHADHADHAAADHADHAEHPGPPGDNRTPPAVLSVRQVAALLGMHPATLYAHMEAGDLPFKPLALPGRKRFSRAQVERFLAAESAGDPGPAPG